MPHVVFDKKIELCDFSKHFIPIFQKEPTLIKIKTVFTDKDKLTVLLPTVVVSDRHQQFLIEISTTKSKTTIRLYPLTEPEKTDDVKIPMVLVAEQIMSYYSDFNISKTNLSDYIRMGIQN